MSAELILNAKLYETRVALVENGQVVELYVERSSDRGIAGNIYKGMVVRVLPGMQAAFVDVGLEKAASMPMDIAIAKSATQVIRRGTGVAYIS